MLIVSSFIVLAMAMPLVFQPTGLNDDILQENPAIPRAAYWLAYNGTIEGFAFPNGIAVNATGHVYIGDSSYHRVQVFDNTSTYQYTIGVASVPGTDNDHFNYSKGVAVNSTGHVYVADSQNHRVQVFDNAGTYQYTIGVTGVSDSDNAHFSFPWGVAVNSTGHVYVADYNNYRVQVFDKAGIYQSTLGGGFSYVNTVTVNGSGYVFVADTSYHRVQVFDNAGIFQYTLGVMGESGFGNDHFNFPQGLTTNATGHLFVADTNNHRVQVFDKAGNYQYTICGNGAGSGNNQLNFPQGVATDDATKRLYISDTYNSRIQVFDVPAPTGQTIAINGGATYSASTSVTLTLSANGVTEMCFSNNGTTYTDWGAYSTSKAWVLTDGLGPKTVYFKTRCELSEAAPISGTITYTLPPTGLSVTINSGAAETNATGVTLSLSATGATEMCFSNDGATWSAWEPFATSKQWTLPDEAGAKIVYFKSRNGTIEAATPVSDTITYTPPSGVPGYPLVVLLAVIGLGTLHIVRRVKKTPRV